MVTSSGSNASQEALPARSSAAIIPAEAVPGAGPIQARKILLMGHADGLGGSQTAFWQLYNFVRQEGHTVKVIALTDRTERNLPFQKGDLLNRIAYQGSEFFLRVKKSFDILFAGLQAQQFQPDIFVCVGLNTSSITIARFLGKACFKLGQDFIADRDINDAMWCNSRAIMDGIGVQAPSMLNQWQPMGTKIAGLNWLPCFPEPPVHGVLRSNRHVPAGGKVRLAYFGRLASNKGLALLLRALADASIADNVTLDLWGKGAEQEALKELTGELGLETRVRFLGGYPPLAEGAELMASYNALVLCSTACEGLPLILLEAMAYGLPFLATDIGAIRDCCTDNADALLVQPTQEDIISGLGTLVEKIEVNAFDSLRARQFYDKTFSYEVMAARWRQCLQNPTLFFYE